MFDFGGGICDQIVSSDRKFSEAIAWGGEENNS